MRQINYKKKYLKYKLKYLALKGGSKFLSLNTTSINEYLNNVTNRLNRVDRENIKYYILKLIKEWNNYRKELSKRLKQKKSENTNNDPFLTENIKQLEELNKPIININNGKLLEDIIYLIVNKTNPYNPSEMEWKIEHMMNFKYAGLPLYSQLSEYQKTRIKMFLDRFHKNYRRNYNRKLPF